MTMTTATFLMLADFALMAYAIARVKAGVLPILTALVCPLAALVIFGTEDEQDDDE